MGKCYCNTINGHPLNTGKFYAKSKCCYCLTREAFFIIHLQKISKS